MAAKQSPVRTYHFKESEELSKVKPMKAYCAWTLDFLQHRGRTLQVREVLWGERGSYNTPVSHRNVLPWLNPLHSPLHWELGSVLDLQLEHLLANLVNLWAPGDNWRSLSSCAPSTIYGCWHHSCLLQFYFFSHLDAYKSTPPKKPQINPKPFNAQHSQ